MSGDLLLNIRLYRLWVAFPFVSDHAPNLFQLENMTLPKAYPFKFNSQWLLDKYFNSLVHQRWLEPKYLQEEDSQRRSIRKVKDLKVISKIWAKESRARGILVMEKLEANIKELLQMIMDGSFNPMVESNLINLESERNKILKTHAELWRLKSRTLWVQSGDLNTQFFHQYANHRRISKHLWEIRDESVHVYKGQKEIMTEA